MVGIMPMKAMINIITYVDLLWDLFMTIKLLYIKLCNISNGSD